MNKIMEKEWFNGFVRLFKTSDIDNDKFIETRTSLKVFKTENIGDSTKNLIGKEVESFLM